ncbi:hypothetical protein ACHAWC_004949 [Mediolabrus comicus]
MVEYYDNDFSFEEHQQESEQKLKSMPSSAETNDSDIIDDDQCAELHPNMQAECWDGFHTNHSTGNFFKPRRYIMKCFPCILDHYASDDTSKQIVSSAGRKRLVLEVGCGSGSSCLPILRNCSESETTVLACDCSAVAVNVCKSVVEKSTDEVISTNFGAFVSDPSLMSDETDTSFTQDVKAAHLQLLKETSTNNVDDIGLADIVLMVFVLSAVPPKRVPRFIKQIYDATKPGGKICFRDYALFDLPMMRFKENHCVHSTCSDSDGTRPRLYARGDGTLSRFFSLDTVKDIFESAGFIMEELRYATVYNDNRKTGERLKRAFVHALFRKP